MGWKQLGGWKTLGVAFVASFLTVSTAQAGLFDFLFGRREPAPVAAPAHPDVTIAKPVAKKPLRTAKHRKPTGLVMLNPLSPFDAKQQMARVIDPVANPDWHLIDPTLKRGDILVLTDRVVVFKGGQIGAPKSYVSLDETRLYNRRERLLIAEMTRQPVQPFLLADKAGPRQPRVLKSASLIRPLELRPGL